MTHKDNKRACARKLGYDRLVHARKVASEKQARLGIELDIYECTACGKFHLTRRNRL